MQTLENGFGRMEKLGPPVLVPEELRQVTHGRRMIEASHTSLNSDENLLRGHCCCPFVPGAQIAFKRSTAFLGDSPILRFT